MPPRKRQRRAPPTPLDQLLPLEEGIVETTCGNTIDVTGFVVDLEVNNKMKKKPGAFVLFWKPPPGEAQAAMLQSLDKTHVKRNSRKMTYELTKPAQTQVRDSASRRPSGLRRACDEVTTAVKPVRFVTFF
jgi:hypothetical protein